MRSNADTGRPPIFGMSRAAAPDLSKGLKVFAKDGRPATDFVVGIFGFRASQLESGVKQRRGVTCGDAKSVAIGPDGICRIKTEMPLPQTIDDGCNCHGRSRVA